MVDSGEGKKASQGADGGAPGAPTPEESVATAETRTERSRSNDGDVGVADDVGFAEVVGQDDLKEALLAVAANDELDGLLVSGEKGTAKSTLVRGLADLLPEQSVVSDCTYGCAPAEPALQCADCRARDAPPTTERSVPLVTLPLGATRDRVVGTLSVADALDGDPTFDPGLLASAHRGVLYVDEVNLLDDHLVDVLLDVAASGVNRVERDGVSVTHPADFTLIGTMNPEEGDLRPQLRDRFALQATATGCSDLDRRVEIVEQALGTRDSGSSDGRRTATGRDGSASWPSEPSQSEPSHSERAESEPPSSKPSESAPSQPEPPQSVPGRRLRRARRVLSEVTLPDEFAERIASCCLDAGLDGHRGDIAMARTARTFAALQGRSCVIESDVRRAATYALPHRLQSQPFEAAPDAEDVIEEHFDDPDAGDQSAGSDGSGTNTGDDSSGGSTSGEDGHDGSGESDHDRSGDNDHDGSSDGGTDGRNDGGHVERGGEGSRGSNAANHGERGHEKSEGSHDGTVDGEIGAGGDADAGSPSPEAEDSSTTDDSCESTTANGDRTLSDERGAGESGRSRDGDTTRAGASACSGDDGSAGNSGAPFEPAPDADTIAPRGSEERREQSDPIVPGEDRARIADVEMPDVAPDGTPKSGDRSGQRTGPTTSTAADGPQVRTRPANDDDPVDPRASVRAAAARGADDVAARDLRAAVRRRDDAALVVFAVDVSASMRPAMRDAKRTVLELLRDAYQQRDEVAFVAFAGDDAEVLLPPTDSVQHAARHLKDVPTGDRTPLPAGLQTAADVVDRADPAASVVVVVSDGRANVADGSPVDATRRAARSLGATASSVLFVDASDGTRRSLADVVATEANARRLSLAALTAERVDAEVGSTTRSD